MSSKPVERTTIRHPSDVLTVLKRWKNRRQENFLAITLDGSHAVIKTHHIPKGIVNRTMIHPRECFWPAIKDCASSVVFAHNHPSGNANPSQEDNETTERLCMAGSILGINVLDHIIITKNDNYYSYRQSGGIKDNFDYIELDEFTDRIAAEGASKKEA
jgi:DNA repair protein RadC